MLGMRNNKQFTVLVHAAHRNSEECFIALFDYGLSKNLRNLPSEDKLKVLTFWINEGTDEGFTAIHYAAFHGNYYLLNFLCE